MNWASLPAFKQAILRLKFSPFSERVDDLTLTIFYSATIPLFIIGILLESIYYNYLNPESKFRQRFGFRKIFLSLTLSSLFIAGLVTILILLYNSEQFGYFIIILTIIVVLILSIIFYIVTSSCCTRKYVKKQKIQDNEWIYMFGLNRNFKIRFGIIWYKI